MPNKYIKRPFADVGDTETVPDDSVNTLVSYETGYTPEYELDPDTDPNGNFVGRQRNNQLFKDITENIKQWQDKLYPEFSADKTGGYDGGFVVELSGVLYRSIVNGNALAPPSAGWVLASPSALQIITTSQTYTPTHGVKSAKVTLVGGGGGTGGVEGQGAGTGGQSAGGGAGATAIILMSELESSYTVVIGAGGVGGVAGNNNGANGGTSSFIGDDTAATSLTASGGEASVGFTASTGSHIETGGVGGVASGGDIHIPGGQGGMGNLVLGTNAGNGHGAASSIGATVRGGRFTENGIPAFSFGSGAGGAAASGTLLDYAGADGFQGVCIIEEFF